MEKCEHNVGWELVEVDALEAQDLDKIDNTHVNAQFRIKARARCLGCGHIAYQSFIWSMDIQLGLKIYPQFQAEGFDDGSGPEDSYA